MEATINRIITLCLQQGGGIQDEPRYRRYLATLGTTALRQRLADLEADAARPSRVSEPVRFWSRGLAKV